MNYSIAINSGWFWVVVAVLVSTLISVLYYRRTQPPIHGSLRLVLTLLRTIALSILLFVLFEPILSMVRSSEDAPRAAVLLDASTSMNSRDAAGDRMPTYRSALSNSGILGLGDQAAIHTFDESVRRVEKFNIDSLQCSGQRTDIERALRVVGDESSQSNIQSVVLFSDGVFTSGANPIYQAEQLAKPIYVVGIGDTNEAKDRSIQSLITNDLSYVGTTVPVQVRARIHGFTDGQATVHLLDNGVQFAEQQLIVRQNQMDYDINLEYKAQSAGVHKLSAVIDAADGELTTKNNSVSEFITVLGSKRNVVIFAGAPSPDLSFIRAAFEHDPSIHVKAFVQKSGAEFYDQAPTSAALRDAETIVFVGFPVQSTPVSVLQMIQSELGRSKPLLFIAGQQTDYNKLRSFEDYLPFSVQTTRPEEFNVMADVKASSSSNPLLRLNGNAHDAEIWNALPPIYRTETFVRVKPESEIVVSMKVNNVSLSDPLIVTRHVQKSKCVAIMGYGLYRWKLLANAAEQSRGSHELPDVLNALMINSSKWLSAQDDEKTVRIRTTRKLYASNERVEFVANVYDEAMTPLDNASVTVKITSSKESREVILTSNGGGRYTASVEGLSEGDYAFNGTVVLNSKAYGNDAGRFSIGELPIEYQNLRMNSELLRSIAERSGGKFYTVKDVDKLVHDLQSHPSFKARILTNTSELNLWNLAVLLAISLLLFSVEWFIRKRAGMV